MVIFNWRYKYPFEPIRLFTFAFKSSCAHILSSIKSPTKLKSLSGIKSLSEELFLIFVSFLLSLSFFSSYSSPSFFLPRVF